MRILIVAHGHPEQTPGGGEIAAYALFRALRDLHLDAWFLARGPAHEPAATRPIAPFRERVRERLLVADGFDRFPMSQRHAATRTALRQLLVDLRPDVLHLQHYLQVGVELIALARDLLPDICIVVTLHEYIAICHHYGLMVTTPQAGGQLCRRAAPQACAACFPGIEPHAFDHRRARLLAHFALVDRCIAPSRFLRQRYVAWGLPDWQVVCLDNVVAETAAAPCEDSRPTRAAFGFFGQIHPYKGLLELMTAVDSLDRGAVPALRLQIHGTQLERNHPDFVARFRDLLDRNPDRISFHGPYRRTELPRLMAAVDWVAVPSLWWENAPLVIEEALAHRRPVLCSGIGGMAEKIRPGLDGFHVPPGEMTLLAALLARVAGDPAVWQRLQHTMRRPPDAAETVRRHVALYAERAVAASL